MGGRPGLPVCAVCTERLGKYGGPSTLPCGHNGCLQCLRSVQANRPACPLCRAPFDPAAPLVINIELRELVQLASALTTEDNGDGWQAVTSARARDSPDADLPYMPSAPPAHLLRVDVEAVLEGTADVLSLEPPQWLPDSSAQACMTSGCSKPFSFLVRSRHHCRCCGRIFCSACTAFLLLPPRFQQPEPQRVCSACSELLMPIQPLLAGTVSRAVQPPVHDLHTDWSVWRSLVNFPHSGSMEGELYKAANALRQATASLGSLKPERGLPQTLFAEAHGLAVISVVKVGAGWSCTLGTGVVVARQGDGSWSAPSSLQALSTGVGWQLGAELADVLVVLRTPAAVRAFCGSQLGLGASASIAAGPLGRAAAASASASLSGGTTMLSYSLSRGMFAGAALEGTLLRPRDAVNWRFYGRRLSAKSLLTTDAVAPPAGASAFYAALDGFMDAVSQPLPQQFALSEGPKQERSAQGEPARQQRQPQHQRQQHGFITAPPAHVHGAVPAQLPFQQQVCPPYQAEEEDTPWGCLFD